MQGSTLPRHGRGSGVAVLGLRQNLAQFMLLVAVNALVGGTLGQERTVLPLLADQVFGLDQYTTALTYIVAFGLAKAATNYFAGTLSDRYGRKPVLIAGWLMPSTTLAATIRPQESPKISRSGTGRAMSQPAMSTGFRP